MNPAPWPSPPIIVIDDDPTMRRACQAALERVGYTVETCPDGASGLQRVEQVRPGVVIVDLKMPGMGGLEVIGRVREIDPEIVVIVITGFATVGTAVEAMKGGAYDFIPKPFTAEELRAIMARAVERWHLTREAARLRREKEAQARKFVTFVSHQLQSPLAAVGQYLDVLRHQMGDAATATQKQWIERCRAKIGEMLAMIADWLTLSKVEGGQLATERVAVAWPEVVRDVLDGLQTAADEKPIQLHNEVPADLPVVRGDRAALRMLLMNLVSNAIKYTPAGGQVYVSGDADDQAVRVSVRDTGIGIAPQHQAHVFEEFYRVKDESTAGISGTGMGLPICKKIAEELGGQMALASEPGQGSTFTVALPRAGP
ncbi:MAG: hybrid sensor histidine kinase/response regulator [Planctomycetota bacterium]